jgi:hypothetical protein
MVLGKILGSGQTATVYEYEDKVIKVFAESTPYKSIEYEFNIGLAINSLPVKAPRTYELIKLCNQFCIVYEKAEGILLRTSLEDTPHKVIRIAKHMAQLHLEIHKNTVNDFIGQSERFERLIRKSEEILGDLTGKICTYLNELPQCSNLCHGDFHLDNIITGNSDYTLDWTNAYKGYPLGDVARTMIILKSPFIPNDASVLVKTFAKPLKSLLLKHYLNYYFRHSKFSKPDMKQFILPLLAARLSENLPEERKWLMNLITEEVSRIE